MAFAGSWIRWEFCGFVLSILKGASDCVVSLVGVSARIGGPVVSVVVICAIVICEVVVVVVVCWSWPGSIAFISSLYRILSSP